MSDPASTNALVEDVACKLITIETTHAALWQQARDACDDALKQGRVFVAILHRAEAFADEHWLTDEDRQRAARFRQPGDRHNFVLGRNLVHHLIRPRGISTPCVFSIGPNGKPFLPDAPAYNLSHSGRWVACAVSRHEPVGIDVETFSHLKDYRELLPTIAHPAERRYIEQAPADIGLALFKRCWTRKEAVLKATGKGLSADLQAIDVCLDQSEPVLRHPMPLRLMHMDRQQVSISLAMSPSIPGLVAMIAEPGGQA